MEGGSLIYKCRRCGKMKKTIHVPDGITAISAIKNNRPLPKEWGPFSPGLIDFCCCDENHIGISDLIGFEKDN